MLMLALVSCLAVLGVAECALRVAAPIYLSGIQATYRYDDQLGYRLAAGIHRFRLTDHLQEIRTNHLGTVNFQESFAGYPKMAFAVGDSFTQGTGLPADASYPFQLDLVWNTDEHGFYEKRLAIVNLGLAAFGGQQSLIALKRYGERLGRPAYILYLGSDNDWEDDVLFESGYRHRHIVPGSPVWGIWTRPILELSKLQLVKRVKIAIGLLRRGRLFSEAGTGTDRDEAAPSVSVAEREWPVIEEIHQLAQEWDATLIVSWANAPGPSYSWLRDKAKEAGIPFADWEPRVASVQAAIPELPFANAHSGGHWRTWANAEIARSFAAVLRRYEGASSAHAAPAP